MGVNTRDRRASAIASGLLFLVIPPLPNGAIDAADRLHLLGFYRGFAELASMPAPACVTLSNAAFTILTLGVEPCA